MFEGRWLCQRRRQSGSSMEVCPLRVNSRLQRAQCAVLDGGSVDRLGAYTLSAGAARATGDCETVPLHTMKPVWELHTADAADTQRLAAVLASTFTGGEVISLTGELGAGKTCFVQGAAQQLGVAQRLTSPSFLLRRDYPAHTTRGDVTLTHVDVYRLNHLSDIDDLGFDDVGQPGFVTFVEWGDAAAALLPEDHLEVELTLAAPTAALSAIDDPDQAEPRHIRLRPYGPQWHQRLDAIGGRLATWRRESPSAEGDG